jgi:hypothetical protein
MVSITAGFRGRIGPSGSPAEELRRASWSGAAAPVARAAPSAPTVEEAIAPTPIVSVGVDALRRASDPSLATAVLPRSAPLPAVAPAMRVSSTATPAQRTSQASVPPQSGPPPRSSTRPWMSTGAAAFVEPGASIPAEALVPAPTEHVRSPVPQARVPEARPSVRPPMESEEELHEDDESHGTVVRGGSQPPFRTEAPPPTFPAAPLIPRLEPERIEKVEALSLPSDLRGEGAPGELPATPLEARVYFTQQARELARLYRERYNVELRTDVRSLELVQRYLTEHFATGAPKSEDDIAEVRRHGAFLSELLARRLGAEWTDLAVSETGYWAMNVPPGITIWPIGRVVRFIAMRHRERDLVSYFLELQARAHGLK